MLRTLRLAAAALALASGLTVPAVLLAAALFSTSAAVLSAPAAAMPKPIGRE